MVETNKTITQKLMHIKRPLLRIPSLAIHLDREVKSGFKFNDETHLTPVLAQHVTNALESDSGTFHHRELLDLFVKELGLDCVEQIKDFEVCLYDTQPASLGGLNEEFIFSARLDNLMMSFCSLNVII